MTHGFSSTGSAQVASPGYAPSASMVAQTRYDTAPVPVIGIQPTEIEPSPGVPDTPVGDGVTAAVAAAGAGAAKPATATASAAAPAVSRSRTPTVVTIRPNPPSGTGVDTAGRQPESRPRRRFRGEIAKTPTMPGRFGGNSVFIDKQGAGYPGWVGVDSGSRTGAGSAGTSGLS